MAASRTSKLGVGVALAAALLGVGVFAGVRFLFFGLEEATPWDKPAQLVEGNLELTYDGRDCRDRVDVVVDESPAAVVVTINETVRALVCDEERSSYDVVVELEAPLGDRELVDGACRLGQFGQDDRCAPDLTPFVRTGAADGS